ncbi:MAG: biotin--[acetyl-CoA-carboxylase] ligase [bacterium]|nr:biotin--[acetyl-CoA-carboxylase] ligase [bacterium]
MAAAAEHPYALVAAELRGTAFADIRYLEQTASTNEDAAALLGDERARGTSIVAEFQSAGVGRKAGRAWLAQPGSSLLLTTILPRSIPAANLWVVPYGVAICVRRALMMSGVTSELHWPNDLLHEGKKIAGILCISRVIGDRAWVGAGVGINVHRTPAADEIAPPPAFCSDANPNVSRAKLLHDLLLNYEVWQETLDMPQRIARVWERQARLPKPYRILKDGDAAPIDVTALALSNTGALIVQHPDGRKEPIALADARALR